MASHLRRRSKPAICSKLGGAPATNWDHGSEPIVERGGNPGRGCQAMELPQDPLPRLASAQICALLLRDRVE